MENYSFSFERTFVKNSSGDDIELLWVPHIPADEKDVKTFLYLHGNVGRLPYIIEGLSRYGNVLSPAYPGYSRSSGTPSTKTINETADLSIKYLSERGIAEKDTVVVGHSLGGAPAVYAAAVYPNLDRVILVNTFLSMEEMCKARYHVFCIFSGGIHNSGKMAPKAVATLREFHNPTDIVIPFAQGKELFKLLGSKDKKFYELSGTHADFPIGKILEE